MNFFLLFTFLITNEVCYSQGIGLNVAKEFTNLNHSNNTSGFGFSITGTKKNITFLIRAEGLFKNTLNKNDCLGCIRDTTIDYSKFSIGAAILLSSRFNNTLELYYGPEMSYSSLDSKYTGIHSNWFSEARTKNIDFGLMLILKYKNFISKNINLHLLIEPIYSIKIKQDVTSGFHSGLSNNQKLIDFGIGLGYLFK